MLTGAGRALWICFSTFSAIGPEIPWVRRTTPILSILGNQKSYQYKCTHFCTWTLCTYNSNRYVLKEAVTL